MLVRHCWLLCGFVALLPASGGMATGAEAVSIGSQRELLVDDFLIDSFTGDVRLQLHKPTPHEVVLVTDKPWEGNTSAYYAIFQDGDLYRMYYRGSHFDEKTRKATHPEVTCYAESRDGIHWTKPNLGLFDFDGSKDNNIVWRGVGTHCFTPFKDSNAASSDAARYKALSRGEVNKKSVLFAFQSPDGLHWSLMQTEPVITTGAFDSQNLGFWDPYVKKYREYHRTFVNGVRSIMTGTSTDFIHWTDPVLLQYGDAPNEHLYTNAVRFYERAPQLLIGFPTRYLPNEGSRVEPIFMSSRDGLHFHRWPDAVIPEDAPKDRGGNRSNYMAWGLIRLPHAPNEYSVYGTEAYYTGPDSRLRRFTYRVDGFVSAHAGSSGGTLQTKPMTFKGSRLEVNYVTQDSGQVRVALQAADGKPLAGFTLKQCDTLRGDAIAQTVTWQNTADVSRCAGRPVRLIFELRNADVFSFRFFQ